MGSACWWPVSVDFWMYRDHMRGLKAFVRVVELFSVKKIFVEVPVVQWCPFKLLPPTWTCGRSTAFYWSWTVTDECCLVFVTDTDIYCSVHKYTTKKCIFLAWYCILWTKFDLYHSIWNNFVLFFRFKLLFFPGLQFRERSSICILRKQLNHVVIMWLNLQLFFAVSRFPIICILISKWMCSYFRQFSVFSAWATSLLFLLSTCLLFCSGQSMSPLFKELFLNVG